MKFEFRTKTIREIGKAILISPKERSILALLGLPFVGDLEDLLALQAQTRLLLLVVELDDHVLDLIRWAIRTWCSIGKINSIGGIQPLWH